MWILSVYKLSRVRRAGIRVRVGKGVVRVQPCVSSSSETWAMLAALARVFTDWLVIELVVQRGVEVVRVRHDSRPRGGSGNFVVVRVAKPGEAESRS
jgi:hypothetical protein